MESIDLLKYKFQQGVFDISDLIILVQLQYITKDDFFEITRLQYDPINKKMGITFQM